MDIVRWGALGFMASGLLWVAAGVFDSFVAVSGFGTGLASLMLPMVALLLLILGMVGLHAIQRPSYGIIGLVGFLAVVLGGLAQIFGVVVFVVGSSSALLWLVSPVGPAVMVIGWVLYGAATLRARVLPRWCGVLFIVSLPVALILELYREIFFGLSGDMFLGVVLLILSYVLWPLGGSLGGPLGGPRTS